MEPNDLPARRVTPLTVLRDLSETVRSYRALGFELVETDDPGCVGLCIGGTYQVLATKAHMERKFSAFTVALLLDRTTPYIYVASLDQAKELLADSGSVVEQGAPADGTREAVVELDGQLLLLAEKLETA